MSEHANSVNGHTNGVDGHTNGSNGTTGHPASGICDSAEQLLNQEYDFVICGGGTAGLVIAARLTEIPEVNVAVLEAGPNRLGDPLVDTPAAFLQMLGNPEYDYMIMTPPQPGNQNKVHHMVRGKMLGGSSGINYMMYVRGSLQDYDDWAELTGDPSWDAENMARYMRKHQTLEPIAQEAIRSETMCTLDEFHGTDGPVKTSFNDFRLPIEDDVVKACDEATGTAKKPNDPWSGDHIGFFQTLGTVVRSGPNKGKRGYAARGYLEPNLDRPNLRVLCDAQVQRVELDGNTATGVSFRHNGSLHTIKARREVLVCGGVVHSPQILELSGIGDPDILRAAGVDCKVENRAVGENFQDHTVTIAGYKAAPGVNTADSVYDPAMMEMATKMYAEQQGGPLSCIQSTQGFFPWKLFATPEERKEVIDSIKNTPTKTDFQKRQYAQIIKHLESDTSANLQMVLVNATPGHERGVQDQAQLFPPVDPSKGQGTTFAVCLQYPVSRGSIHIKSSDPNDLPVVDPQYNSHSADIAVSAAGLKMVDKAVKTKHLKGKLTTRMVPRPELDLQDTEQARLGVTEWTMGEYHPCSSVAAGAALDSHLRVHGVNNLRVADASVFPNHVSGNIVSSVYAVAEKAADIIKADNGYPVGAKKVAA